MGEGLLFASVRRPSAIKVRGRLSKSLAANH